MTSLINNFNIAGSAVSLLGVVSLLGTNFQTLTLPQKLLGFATLLYVLWVCTMLLLNRTRSFKRGERNKIDNYMFDLLNKSGSVAISTKDMSWASDARIKDLLESKASRGELIICQPRDTHLSQSLRERGAVVRIYKNPHYIPTSRFTIVDFGREGARVVIARIDKEKHYVEEYKHDSPAFHLAQDLVNALREND